MGLCEIQKKSLNRSCVMAMAASICQHEERPMTGEDSIYRYKSYFSLIFFFSEIQNFTES